ncbi:hypothetical protein ACHAXR_006881 [Thalassiosira sp. AJA248-18]
MSSKLDQYLWIAVVGGIFGFIFCFSIGANDVANAFATSVASKSIKLKQAVIIASICEFCGVLFLGGSSHAVLGKMFNTDVYEDEPEVFMLGMLTSLVSASFMMMGATYYGLPVSAVHTVSVLQRRSPALVNWVETKNIFLSWIVSPLLTGAIGFIIFLLIKRCILLSAAPFDRGYYAFSFILCVTIGINLFFIFNKGTSQDFQENVYDNKWVVPTSFGIGAVVGLVWLWPVGPRIKHKVEAKRALPAVEQTANPAASVRSFASVLSIGSSIGGHKERKGEFLVPEYDPEHSASSVRSLASVHSIGSSIGGYKERRGSIIPEYDPEEGLVKFSVNESLKSLKFALDSEVAEESETEEANAAIVPLATIIDIYQTGQLNPEASFQKWILVYGGVALSLGLLLYGYKVIKTIGFKLTALSPTRGSSASLSSSLVVATAAYIGIPVSSTQCIVGAVAGIGLVDGHKNVQWKHLLKCLVGWVLVFFASAIISAMLFAFCGYSPSLTC